MFFFFVFLKYMPSPRDFNKFFIKSIMNARYEKTIFFVFFLNAKSCNVFFYIYIYIFYSCIKNANMIFLENLAICKLNHKCIF
jgi:hypothetical protein